VKVNFYTWSETDQQTKDKIFARAQADISRAEDVVRPIIEDVRLRGDDALRDYALKFDGAKVEHLKCTEAESFPAGVQFRAAMMWLK
jgi:histidinol dehydrogenase